MGAEILAAILVAIGVGALFVLLDKGADALREKYPLPEGGLLGLLWRRLTGAGRNKRGR